ncbi:unnamed protein product [Parascedosporium putredinis]|uniref:SUZ domain-containing protein n=1 Tax=Parascedosporium putredinis TaxID=1442378 RepID=A0A9P1H5H8_9PEZI|nr:unnamed protein product [Parascedosporium putredinis]CAI7997848.1 unnamed protein product [Parascedosporium putredinis]
MSAPKKGKHVPNAWDDDDWEVLADRAEKEPTSDPQPPVRLTKTERLAQHHESNPRSLTHDLLSFHFAPRIRDAPEPQYFLETGANLPLATAYKTQVKVLSRKPVIARRDPTGALANLAIRDDQDDRKEEKEVKMTPEERMALEKSMLEEKQRAYDEARRRIFGDEPAQEEQVVKPPSRADGPLRGDRTGEG